MEVTLSATGTALLSISKTLPCSTAASHAVRTQLALHYSQRFTTTANTVFRRSSVNFGSKSPLLGLRINTGSAIYPVRCLLECVSSSAASFASSSGSDSGGGVGDGGEVKANPISGGVDDVSPLLSDVIVLDVGGMMCGGCASSVKRILENQAQVSSASVNHTTETAIVWPISEAKVTPNWQKVIGEELAKHLTTCGFNSNLRGEAATEGEPS